ncbi:aspartate aminotransferase family protein [Streptomyces sp. 5K101]|uniref:aspartate aminotransferase family protein n=1 Tax=Streptomyces sp. 5K101 TaxID=3390037 RepID=UPI00397660AB
MSETSAELVERAARVIPGGVNSGRRRTTPPLVVQNARGAYLEDADGQQLVDYYGGAGTAVLGHADPFVTESVASASARGLHAGVGVSLPEIELAEQLTEVIPSADQVLLCNSGSEATAYAVRLARAVTNRPFIVRMEGSYHGWHDAVIPFSPGVVPHVNGLTLTCTYNNLAVLDELFRRYPDRIAGVILEPLVHNCGPTVMPDDGYLKAVRALCDDFGALLIFDEVVTGVRHHLGGVQALWGIHPHLTTMGKALGNGFPIGVVAGPSHLMQQWNTHDDGKAVFAGTFNGNGAAVAAALAVLDRLRDGQAHAHMFRLGEAMRTGLQEVADRAGVQAHATGFGSAFTLWFGPRPRCHLDVRKGDHQLFARYRRTLRTLGHFEKADVDGGRSVISASHTERDIAATLEAAGPALRAALDAGRGES